MFFGLKSLNFTKIKIIVLAQNYKKEIFGPVDNLQASKQRMVGCFLENQAKQVSILSKVCLLKRAMFATN